MGFHRSGSWAARANERDQPYIVEMVIPEEGFGHRLRLAMDGFHRSRNIRARFGRHFRRDGKDYCRWCFADPSVAELFHNKFGGERLVDNAGLTAAESLTVEPEQSFAR